MKPIVIIAIAVVFLFVPVSTYATHEYDEDYSNDPDYEGKTPLRFYTIYASYYNDCSKFDEKKLNFYNRLSFQYLGMYDFLPITGHTECVKVKGVADFDSDNTYGLTLDVAVNDAKKWHPDVIIIVLDTLLSYQYFLDTWDYSDGSYVAGHYRWGGDFRQIVVPTPIESLEGQDGAWILSHELAHFALEYKGYPRSILEGYVHEIQNQYDICKTAQFQYDYCKNTFSYFKSYDRSFKVLKPYEPQVYSEPIIQDSDGDGYADNEDSCPTQRENFNGYQDYDGCPDNPNSNQNNVNNDPFNKLLTDYVKKKVELKTEILNKINEYRYLNFESPLGNAKHGYVMNELRSINFETSDYNVGIAGDRWVDGLHSVGESGVREEIKELYGIANDLRQLDREITKAKSLESEFKSKQIQEKNEIFKSNEKIASQNLNPSLYVIGNDGKKSKQLTIKPNEKFTIEGYIYKNNMPQKYTTYKILDNIGNTKDGKTNNDGFFRHVLTSEHSVHQNFGQGSDESSTTIIKVCVSSNCESVKVFVRGDNNESQSNLNNSNENQSENMLQNNGEPSKHAELKLKHEVQDLQTSSHDKINSVKKEIKESKRSLEHIPQDSPEKIKKINQAWDLLKDTQTKLDEVESRVKTGNVQLSYGNYENAKSFFNNNDQMNEKIDENLKKVTQLVNETSKPQTCFLFWCW